MRPFEHPSQARRAFLESMLSASAFVLAPTLARASNPSESSRDEGPLRRLTQRPANYESVRSTFTTRITPLDRFYIRCHHDVPSIDVRNWKLNIAGMVNTPLSLSLDDLAKMKQVSVEAVLQCAGNGRALFRPRVPGVQWQRGAMGNAVWKGVPLRDLLLLAGHDLRATSLHLLGADTSPLPSTPRFVRAIPIGKALHPDTIVAIEMNGERLPLQQGAPARLVVPGWVADDWVKWLSSITLRDAEPDGFFYQTAYRFPLAPVEKGAAVSADQMKPMSQLNVKSIIGSHETGDVLRPGKQQIIGVAFAGESGVRSVDVTVDGGKTWNPATLSSDRAPYGFARFQYEWNATLGRFRIASRATDKNGVVQPEQPAWNPSGYLYNAIDPIEVEVRP